MKRIIDPEGFEEDKQTLFERLRRRHVAKCEACGGKGTIVVGNDWQDEFVPVIKTENCKCLKKALFHLELFSSGVPEELWRAERIDPESNEKNFKDLRFFANNFPMMRSTGASLLLVGKNGTGKTSGAAIAMAGAIRSNHSAQMISFPELIECVRKNRFNSTVEKRIRRALSRDLLVLDEIGKEGKVGDRDTLPIQELDVILRNRRGNLKPTILITNFTLPEFFKHYGDSIKSLVASPYKVLIYKPGDFRPKLPNPWDSFERGGE